MSAGCDCPRCGHELREDDELSCCVVCGFVEYIREPVEWDDVDIADQPTIPLTPDWLLGPDEIPF